VSEHCVTFKPHCVRSSPDGIRIARERPDLESSVSMRYLAAPLMRRIPATAAAVVIAACSGSSADLTDLAGNTGKREVVSRAFGDPLPQMTAEELSRHAAGESEFIRNRNAAQGLGPVMTGIACFACHDAPPATGGTNQRIETRFGRRNADGSLDDLISLGGPMLQDEGIGRVNTVNYVPEKVPAEANVVTGRRTPPLFGLGLVDATPDATFTAIAAYQLAHEPSAAGRPAKVLDMVSGKTAVGRFGWKAVHPTLLQFNADAFVNEMGITNPLFPHENCPQGDCGQLSENPSSGVNDPDGVALNVVTDFTRFLGPPPRKSAASNGAATFKSIGCAVCHVQTLVTGPNPEPALDRVAYHPFSDFLLHDMGTLGDGLDQGDAKATEMRTQPLWGVSQQTRLLHDGRARNVTEAILAHEGQGKPAKDRFSALSEPDRSALLAFISSL
jgi:CxxC motif-containing protein (DUF1111 family)